MNRHPQITEQLLEQEGTLCWNRAAFDLNWVREIPWNQSEPPTGIYCLGQWTEIVGFTRVNNDRTSKILRVFYRLHEPGREDWRCEFTATDPHGGLLSSLASIKVGAQSESIDAASMGRSTDDMAYEQAKSKVSQDFFTRTPRTYEIQAAKLLDNATGVKGHVVKLDHRDTTIALPKLKALGQAPAQVADLRNQLQAAHAERSRRIGARLKRMIWGPK